MTKKTITNAAATPTSIKVKRKDWCIFAWYAENKVEEYLSLAGISSNNAEYLTLNKPLK